MPTNPNVDRPLSAGLFSPVFTEFETYLIPETLTDLARTHDLKPIDTALLIALFKEWQAEPQVHVTQSYLATRLNVNRRTVQIHLNTLRRKGLLDWRQQAYRCNAYDMSRLLKELGLVWHPELLRARRAMLAS